jgi:hypothetical protein
MGSAATPPEIELDGGEMKKLIFNRNSTRQCAIGIFLHRSCVCLSLGFFNIGMLWGRVEEAPLFFGISRQRFDGTPCVADHPVGIMSGVEWRVFGWTHYSAKPTNI